MLSLYIPKVHNNYADVLLSRGVAELVKNIAEQNSLNYTKINIKDTGGFYIVSTDIELTKANIENINYERLTPNFKPNDIKAKEETNRQEKLADLVMNSGSKTIKTNKVTEQIEKMEFVYPYLVQYIIDFFSNPSTGLEKFDRKIKMELKEKERIKKFNDFKENLLKLIPKGNNKLKNEVKDYITNKIEKNKSFHWSLRNQVEKIFKENNLDKHSEDDIDKIRKKISNKYECEFTANAVKEFIPNLSKGLNREDLSNNKRRISPSNVGYNIILLYLISIGYYKTFNFKYIVAGDKFNKLYYVVKPKNISIKELDEVSNKLIANYNFNVDILEKQNILMINRLNQLNNELKGEIGGFQNAFLYKLGQSPIIKTIYDLEIPSLFKSDGLINVLDELFKILQYTDKEKCLVVYEDLNNYLTTQNSNYLFDFYIDYSQYLIDNLLESKFWLKLYTREGLKKILKEKSFNYLEVFENDGFLHFANAIKNSTINIVYEKKAEGTTNRKIRYNLIEELKGVANNEKKLVEKITEFMEEYNQENMMLISQNNSPKRDSLSEDDLIKILGLIEKIGPKLFTNLLLSYGLGKVKKRRKRGE